MLKLVEFVEAPQGKVFIRRKVQGGELALYLVNISLFPPTISWGTCERAMAFSKHFGILLVKTHPWLSQ